MKTLFYLPVIFIVLLSQAQERLYPYSINNKWGITNNKLEILIAPQYDTSFWFQSNTYAIVQKDRKFGAIAKDGKVILPVTYDKLNDVNGSIGIGRQQNKYAFINLQTGKLVTPVLFDSVDDFCYCPGKLFVVRNNKRKGFFNATTAKPVGKITYDDADFFREFDGKGIVTTGGKKGIMDLNTGDIIVKIAYDQIELEYKGDKRVIEAINGKESKFFDEKGKEFVEEKKMAVEEEGILEETAMAVVDDGGSDGNKDIYFYNQGNGNWKVTIERRNRYSNSTEILETYEFNGYEKISKFYYNSYNREPANIKATKGSKTGIINTTGKVIVPFVYDDIEFNYSYNKTRLDGRIGILNSDFTELKKPVFKKIIRYEGALDAWYIEMPGGQKGYMDKISGKIYIPGINE